ncbi:PREDICTED: uncharacterized protein LOC109164466 [Ipomoea nil]|uniref:uncharacterized protein LOC109164466 n=1 Tax=Ipomoea nil TaxID=35883 RepID=UPI0009018038|nr:PREDICTED: uncharacterized protein LOC109164466 [Ipomoea nil]
MWRRCNLMVCSWIFKAVDSSIAQSVIHLEKASDVWNDLRRRFAQCDAQRISILQNEIYNLKQGSLTVSEYYTRCRTMWEEMNAMRPLPAYLCTGCACNLADKIRKERDIDQVIRFLQGLNDDYNALKSNVLILDPLPEVYKIYVMAETVERQINMTNLLTGNLEISQANAIRNIQTSTEEVVVAFNPYNGKKYMNNGVNKTKCTFCGLTGHTIEKCYKKHGYPPGWVPGYKSKAKQQITALVVNGTNDLGVSVDQFQKLMAAIQNQMGHLSSSSATAAVSLVPRFDPDQNEGKFLTSHINSISLCNSSWILDSGATDHITCSTQFFHEYRAIEGDEVSLPTGERIAIKHRGNIHIGEGLWLKDAMHIP